MTFPHHPVQGYVRPIGGTTAARSGSGRFDGPGIRHSRRARTSRRVGSPRAASKPAGDQKHPELRVVRRSPGEGGHGGLHRRMGHDASGRGCSPDADLARRYDTVFPTHGAAREALKPNVAHLRSAVNRSFKQEPHRGNLLHACSGGRPIFVRRQGKPGRRNARRRLRPRRDGRRAAADHLRRQDHHLPRAYRARQAQATRRVPADGPARDRTRAVARRGDPGGDCAAFAHSPKTNNPWMPQTQRCHCGRPCGARVACSMGGATALRGLGRPFGGLLCEAEARYLSATARAMPPEDVLRHRPKHRLHRGEADQAAFADRFEAGRGTRMERARAVPA